APAGTSPCRGCSSAASCAIESAPPCRGPVTLGHLAATPPSVSAQALLAQRLGVSYPCGHGGMTFGRLAGSLARNDSACHHMARPGGAGPCTRFPENRLPLFLTRRRSANLGAMRPTLFLVALGAGTLAAGGVCGQGKQPAKAPPLDASYLRAHAE